MWLVVVGLPLVVVSILTHTYTIHGIGACFLVERLEWGPYCFSEGSLIPRFAEFGPLAIGTMMVAVGLARMPNMFGRSPRVP